MQTFDTENFIVVIFFILIVTLITVIVGYTIYRGNIQHQEVMHCLEMHYPIEQCMLLNNIR